MIVARIFNRNGTHASHLHPDGVVIGEGALEVGRQLARVDVLRQALQARQVRLKERWNKFFLLLPAGPKSCFKAKFQVNHL